MVGGQWVSPRGTGTGTRRRPAAGAGRLRLTERCFKPAPTPAGPPTPTWGAPAGQGGAVPGHPPLPGQGGQQAAGSAGGSAQERGHSLFSQLTSPSWRRGAKHHYPPPRCLLPPPVHPPGHLAHLAGTAGAGLALGGEALAVHHLPPLVVAVCGEWDGARRGVVGVSGSPRCPLFPVPTVTDGAALALGVEGVGAEDGTVHGRAGHRAQLRR